MSSFTLNANAPADSLLSNVSVSFTAVDDTQVKFTYSNPGPAVELALFNAFPNATGLDRSESGVATYGLWNGYAYTGYEASYVQSASWLDFIGIDTEANTFALNGKSIAGASADLSNVMANITAASASDNNWHTDRTEEDLLVLFGIVKLTTGSGELTFDINRTNHSGYYTVWNGNSVYNGFAGKNGENFVLVPAKTLVENSLPGTDATKVSITDYMIQPTLPMGNASVPIPAFHLGADFKPSEVSNVSIKFFSTADTHQVSYDLKNNTPGAFYEGAQLEANSLVLELSDTETALKTFEPVTAYKTGDTSERDFADIRSWNNSYRSYQQYAKYAYIDAIVPGAEPLSTKLKLVDPVSGNTKWVKSIVAVNRDDAAIGPLESSEVSVRSEAPLKKGSEYALLYKSIASDLDDINGATLDITKDVVMLDTSGVSDLFEAPSTVSDYLLAVTPFASLTNGSSYRVGKNMKYKIIGDAAEVTMSGADGFATRITQAGGDNGEKWINFKVDVNTGSRQVTFTHNGASKTVIFNAEETNKVEITFECNGVPIDFDSEVLYQSDEGPHPDIIMDNQVNYLSGSWWGPGEGTDPDAIMYSDYGTHTSSQWGRAPGRFGLKFRGVELSAAQEANRTEPSFKDPAKFRLIGRDNMMHALAIDLYNANILSNTVVSALKNKAGFEDGSLSTFRFRLTDASQELTGFTDVEKELIRAMFPTKANLKAERERITSLDCGAIQEFTFTIPENVGHQKDDDFVMHAYVPRNLQYDLMPMNATNRGNSDTEFNVTGEGSKFFIVNDYVPLTSSSRFYSTVLNVSSIKINSTKEFHRWDSPWYSEEIPTFPINPERAALRVDASDALDFATMDETPANADRYQQPVFVKTTSPISAFKHGDDVDLYNPQSGYDLVDSRPDENLYVYQIVGIPGHDDGYKMEITLEDGTSKIIYAEPRHPQAVYNARPYASDFEVKDFELDVAKGVVRFGVKQNGFPYPGREKFAPSIIVCTGTTLEKGPEVKELSIPTRESANVTKPVAAGGTKVVKLRENLAMLPYFRAEWRDAADPGMYYVSTVLGDLKEDGVSRNATPLTYKKNADGTYKYTEKTVTLDDGTDHVTRVPETELYVDKIVGTVYEYRNNVEKEVPGNNTRVETEVNQINFRETHTFEIPIMETRDEDYTAKDIAEKWGSTKFFVQFDYTHKDHYHGAGEAIEYEERIEGESLLRYPAPVPGDDNPYYLRIRDEEQKYHEYITANWQFQSPFNVRELNNTASLDIDISDDVVELYIGTKGLDLEATETADVDTVDVLLPEIEYRVKVNLAADDLVDVLANVAIKVNTSGADYDADEVLAGDRVDAFVTEQLVDGPSMTFDSLNNGADLGGLDATLSGQFAASAGVDDLEIADPSDPTTSYTVPSVPLDMSKQMKVASALPKALLRQIGYAHKNEILAYKTVEQTSVQNLAAYTLYGSTTKAGNAQDLKTDVRAKERTAGYGASWPDLAYAGADARAPSERDLGHELLLALYRANVPKRVEVNVMDSSDSTYGDGDLTRPWVYDRSTGLVKLQSMNNRMKANLVFILRSKLEVKDSSGSVVPDGATVASPSVELPIDPGVEGSKDISNRVVIRYDLCFDQFV